MMRMVFLSAVLVLCAVPALAYQSRCVVPYAPSVPDGGIATKPQMNSAHTAVVGFIKQSDQYQDCLLLELKMEKQTAAHKQKTFDTQIETDIKKMIAANQREKERVGAEYNGAAHIYNELHP